MTFANAKVYFDGSHYIAIPHSTNDSKRRPSIPEEVITVKQIKGDISCENESSVEAFSSSKLEENSETDNLSKEVEKSNVTPINSVYVEKKLTRKELFNELYAKYIDLSKKERKIKIKEEMLPYFSSQENCESFIDINFERKQRNLIVRRVRMCRKAYLAHFNYFCTFTYNDKKHTEVSFKRTLKYCFANFCRRKNWKYMGVWERSPKTNRLHFHGLFNIPNDTLPGNLTIVRDYDTTARKMQESIQSSYFNERFGRSDFKAIGEGDKDLGNELAYLMKYIEKTGEKIVYSKNLPQYFLSDILDKDVVCTIGQEDKKLLLLDDFLCLEDGCIIGNVCPEVIEQMPKCNS